MQYVMSPLCLSADDYFILAIILRLKPSYSALLHDQVLPASCHSQRGQKNWGNTMQWMMENTLKATYFQEYERKEGEQKIKDEQFGSHLVDR